jgi:hypothetical protein
MCSKGKVLGSDNKGRGNSEVSQKTDERRRTLQALDLFEIEGRGHVDGVARTFTTDV